MKLSLVVLATLWAFACSGPVEQPKYKVADKAFLEKQKYVLYLFNHVNQPDFYPEHVQIAKSFSFDNFVDHFVKPEVVKEFLYGYKTEGFLPKGEIFSVFNFEHLEQAKVLFKLFYYAKDFETFYKAAAWAKINVNEGLFLYSFSVAVVHRQDTYGIILPPIYEVYPYYFFNAEVMQKAYWYKQTHSVIEKEHPFVINANYSGFYLNLHPEQSMSYFTEDVGINAFYYYYNLYYPSWMSGEEFGLKKDNRGELFYFIHQQLLARYYLERLSNGFGEIPHLNWDFLETPYYPSLEYANGLEFPSRPAYAKLHEYFYNYGQKWTSNVYGYSHSFVEDYERRINDIIDKGYFYTSEGKFIDLRTPEGFNMLGNIIESNPDSLDSDFYGDIQFFARHLLGYSFQPLNYHQVVPSALEHYETSLRDPAFYQFYKKLVMKFQRMKYFLPAYTEKDLFFNGVKINKVEFDDLVTYFDYFYSDLTNGIYYSKEEVQGHAENVHLKVKQERLNHKPFTYKIWVDSNKAQKSVVKIFLGPKYDEYGREITLSENRMNMVLFDDFVWEMKTGENVITRNSHENPIYGADRTSFSDLYKHVMTAYAGQEEFKVDGSQNYFWFPKRFMLPKGSEEGMTYQFFVMVVPYVPYHAHQETSLEYFYPKVGTGSLYTDGYPLGYPFDRFIKWESMWWNIPNSYFYDATIYHKAVTDINVPHH